MASKVVQVPVSLLLCPDLSASAKLIWMVSRLRTASDQAGTAWLCAASGLSRPTVLRGKADLTAAGWDLTSTGDLSGRTGATVPVPARLLTNRRLGINTRILYGLLLLTTGFSHPSGQFTHAELASLAQASPNTVARAADELARAEWIKVKRANRLARVHFELTFPGLTWGMTAIAAAQNRLEKAQYFGEGLMREYLSLLVDSEDYEDDAAPGFLVNPRTAERLQLDRFYPPGVAFEYNGPQHYRATERFSADEVAGQRERDYIKLGICVARGITLVTVHPEDLSLKGMQQKIETLLPLRDLTDCDLLIDYLEAESSTYRRHLSRI